METGFVERENASAAQRTARTGSMWNGCTAKRLLPSQAESLGRAPSARTIGQHRRRTSLQAPSPHHLPPIARLAIDDGQQD